MGEGGLCMISLPAFLSGPILFSRGLYLGGLPGQRPPGQRTLDRGPQIETPLERDPMNKDPETETPRHRHPPGHRAPGQRPPGQILPGQRSAPLDKVSPWTETPNQRHLHTITNGQYASYWKAFLLLLMFYCHPFVITHSQCKMDSF